MSWEAVTALSSVLTAIVIAVTAVVAIYQLQHLRAQRQDAAAIELVRSLQDPELAKAFSLIMSAPPGISAQALRELGAEYDQAAHLLGLRFEMLGILVYTGAVSFDVTEDLAAGGVVASWKRLGDAVLERRKTENQPAYLEWFEWLAAQYEKRGVLQRTPACERHRDWVPPQSSRR